MTNQINDKKTYAKRIAEGMEYKQKKLSQNNDTMIVEIFYKKDAGAIIRIWTDDRLSMQYSSIHPKSDNGKFCELIEFEYNHFDHALAVYDLRLTSVSNIMDYVFREV